MQTIKNFLRRLARLLGLGADAESHHELCDLARKVEPDVGIEDLNLAEPRRSILKDILARARSKREGSTLAIFVGDGTGTVRAAQAVAKDLQRDLYLVDLSKVFGKFIGETEKNLHRLFKDAESLGAILFFEEADALFEKRSEVKDSHDRFNNIEINNLLLRLETYKGLAILATNKEPALHISQRRFHYVADFSQTAGK